MKFIDPTGMWSSSSSADDNPYDEDGDANDDPYGNRDRSSDEDDSGSNKPTFKERVKKFFNNWQAANERAKYRQAFRDLPKDVIRTLVDVGIYADDLIAGISGYPKESNWAATYLEYTIGAGFTAYDNGDALLSGGLSIVYFQNLKTGSNFVGLYTFYADEAEALTLSGGLGLGAGQVRDLFPSNFSQQEIAESFEGPFYAAGVSSPVGPGGNRIKGNPYWSGWSASLSAGEGGQVGVVRTQYKLQSTMELSEAAKLIGTIGYGNYY